MILRGGRHARLRSPLARRLIVAVILFSSVITLVLTSFQLYGEYRHDLRGIEAQLAQIEQVHLKPLTQSLWATNTKDLTLQLEGVVQLPNFEYVAVHDGLRQWAEAGQRRSRSTIERQYPMQHRHRDNSLLIGTLTVVTSLDNIYRHLLNQALVILASNALKTFLVAGFLLLFFHWLVTRHLLAITEHVRGMNPGSALAPLALARPAGRPTSSTSWQPRSTACTRIRTPPTRRCATVNGAFTPSPTTHRTGKAGWVRTAACSGSMPRSSG